MPRLLAELRARGIGYLSGERDPAVEAEVAAHPLAAAALLLALAACEEPRVRDATIALLLLHPELASTVPSGPLVEGRDDGPRQDAHEQVFVLALAAMYLQRMWRSKLRLTLGPRADLACEQWRALGLPAPAEEQGEAGLRALAAYERARTERDFEDVVALAQSGRVSLAQLDRAFGEVLPRVATEGIGAMDPERFAGQYAYLKARLDQAAG